jgi:hypothetical protein
MNTKITSFVLVLALAAVACAWMPIPYLPVPPNPASEEKGTSANPTSAATLGLSGTRRNTLEAATRAYYDAWLELDADRMTALISDFSLERASLSRDSARAELKKFFFDGWILEDYEILESRMLDSTTALVRIVLKAHQGSGEPSTNDLWVAFHLENGEWRINWNGIVDVMPLTTPAQSINGLEIQPVEVRRFTDHLTVVLSIRNTTPQKILWGLNNDVVLTAFFPGGGSKDLQGAYSIEPNREFLVSSFRFDGLVEVYPEVLRLAKFMATDQWGMPRLDAAHWSYDFSLIPAARPNTSGS